MTSEMIAPVPPPSIGRVVHYTLPYGPNAGQPRRADVLFVEKDGTVALGVSLLPTDTTTISRLVVVDHDRAGGVTTRDAVIQCYEYGVAYDPDGKPGTWRYPPVVR